ncbi:putative inorganic phosphate cotransporter [Oppia nitens]|uniref:putative inorganic phosphate cotransporter n=1 Tax=Oppia nitens TaxID=1686743 RepID=UPI0023DBA4CD|nr:putative inorganic phosphate cotransporter [Oppia nitens]
MSWKSGGQQCFSYIPSRYVFILLTAWGLFMVYAFKGFLGVAIVAMVKNGDKSESYGQECRVSDTNNDIVDDKDNVNGFDWDDKQQATVLGCYFYGYIVLQIPAGALAELFGAKWIFGGSMLITSLLSLLGPIIAQWGYVPFLITRIVQGLAQGVILPCMNAMIARWATKMERSRAISLIFSGAALGSVVVLPLTGYLCDQSFLGGWPAIFYVLGIMGIVWFILWSVFVYDSPDNHPFISESEYNYIIKGQGLEKTSSKRVIPWKSILSSYRVYAMIITHFGQNWGYLTILTLMPTYFTKILLMDIKTNGLLSSLPYLSQAIVSIISSYISDKIRERDVINVSLLRKINNSIAFFGPAICMVAIVAVECNQTLCIVLFVLALGLNGFCYPGFNSNYVDMSPDFSGVLMGICNCFGNIPGFVAPIVAANFYSKGQTLANWSHVFYTCVAVYVFTQVIHILFSTAELQPWGISGGNNKENNNNNNNLNVRQLR